MKLLIDTDAIIALSDKNDSGYTWATKVAQEIKDKNIEELYLSNYSYGEIITLLSMKKGVEFTVEVAKTIEKNYFVIDADKKLRLTGLNWFKKQTSKNSRFTDCVNMALMRKLDISHIFSRDKHYKKNGFVRMGMDT